MHACSWMKTPATLRKPPSGFSEARLGRICYPIRYKEKEWNLDWKQLGQTEIQNQAARKLTTRHWASNQDIWYIWQINRAMDSSNNWLHTHKWRKIGKTTFMNQIDIFQDHTLFYLSEIDGYCLLYVMLMIKYSFNSSIILHNAGFQIPCRELYLLYYSISW